MQKPELNVISVEEQQTDGRISLYKMALQFKLSIGLRQLQGLLKDCGFDDVPLSANQQVVTMEQTVPFIPDDDTIKEYERVIKENYKDERTVINSCKFIGYKYIHKMKRKTMKRIVILGGSFNPPTLAHEELLEQIMCYLSAEKGIYVPSSDFYVTRKCERNKTPFTFSETERYMMLKSICKPDMLVDTCEYGDTTKGRTHTTLLEIACKYPDYEIVFVMGSDKLGILPKWKLATMLDKFKIAVITRRGYNPETLINNSPILQNHKSAFIILPELTDHCETSSSAVQSYYKTYTDEHPEDKRLKNADRKTDCISEDTFEILRSHIAAL